VRDFNQKTHSSATVRADYDCSGRVFVCVCKHMDCINRVIAQREGWYLVDKAEFVLQ